MRDDPTLRVSIVVPIFHYRPIGFAELPTEGNERSGRVFVAQCATVILQPSSFIL